MADPDPERFAVVVVPNPPAACPGDPVDFVVFVQNLTNSPQFFQPYYGLLLANGPQRHIIAGFSTTVGAGETVSVVVTATLPDLRPGTYGVWAVSGPGGTFRVLDPAAPGS